MLALLYLTMWEVRGLVMRYLLGVLFGIVEVLVNTLGREKAWHELWDKLNTTLSQIRYVYIF